MPVIAGCGSNDTRNALMHMQFSKRQARRRRLCVAPYYNRPSQAGLIAHFSHLARKLRFADRAVQCAGPHGHRYRARNHDRTGQRFPDRIVAIKDASDDLSRVADHRMGIGPDFCQLSGNDELALPFNAAGGAGCISVTANVAPALCAEFQRACAEHDLVQGAPS